MLDDLFAPSEKNSRDSVRDVQHLVNIMSGKDVLRPDGVVGDKTMAALEDMPASRRSVVFQLARTRGVRLNSRKEMVALTREIARREGIPERTALAIIQLESKFDPSAVSPTRAKGLGQLTTVAIADIAQRGGYVVRDAMDPEQNLIGTMRYIRICASELGVPLSDTASIYMAFNIGPTGARHVRAGRPEMAARVIEKQAYGSPPSYASNLARAVDSAAAMFA